MQDLIFAFLIAFVVAWIMTPVCIRLAYKVGAIDIPKDERRVHSRPIPRFGGLAMYLGAVVSILVTVPLTKPILGLLAGATIIFLVGIYDDLHNLSAKVKLLFQIGAASVLYFTETQIAYINNPFGGGESYIFFSPFISYLLTVVWIVGITNAINLIDGLDGLAAGLAFIASLSLSYSAFLNGSLMISVLTLALAGAALGFLPYNFNPAKIFMGDGGSLFLGFMLAGISLGTLKSSAVIITLVPLLALALPIFDTAFAIVRRAANKRPIMEADKGHLHHRIMAKGMSQKTTVMLLYAISGILGICAVLISQGAYMDTVFLFIAAATVVYVFLKPSDGEGKKKEGEISVDVSGAKPKEAGKIRVMTVFGTRPEAIKMAPVVKALEADEAFESILCVTAQHREMLDQVLALFQLKPKYDLNIMKPHQSLSMITSNVIGGLDQVMEAEKPDLVLVHGDTTTTFAASLSAFYHKVKIGHVEAGLRTYDKYSPYPEEMNRVLTGHLADIHFAPTKTNRDNLTKEGIPEKTIYITGNTVIDALLKVTSMPYEFEDETLKNIDFSTKRVITVTCHRRENLGENMVNIFSAIRDIAQKYDDVEIVYPVHLNPAVQKTAGEILEGIDRVHLIKPLQYQPFSNLMARSYLILTDSGGIQEEAPALGKPVLVVRKETERPEAILAGTARLAGVKQEEIFHIACELLDNPDSYESMARATNPYGDGTASKQILGILKKVINI